MRRPLESASVLNRNFEFGQFYNEMFTAQGEPRPHDHLLYDQIRAMTPDDLTERASSQPIVIPSIIL